MVWAVLAATLFLQVADPVAQPPAPPSASARIDPRALRDSLERQQLRFFHSWSGAWRLSEQQRHSAIDERSPNTHARNLHLHCHPHQDRGFAGVRPGSMIVSASGAYAVCPTWHLGDETWPDERHAIDLALEPHLRGAVQADRANLLRLFEDAAQRLPADDWILGQLVRLLVDQREVDRALELVRGCKPARWWCNALSGYLFTVQNETVRADSAFAGALREMPEASRCEWNDLRVLLDSTAEASYRPIRCAARDSANERIWWLSDPLWIVDGNERRAEHYARKVALALRTALDRDERYDWRAGAGGDALSAMVMFYGWPSYTFWVHERMDASHSGYLREHATALNDNYTTFEYSPGRLSTVPTWEAIEQPLLATSQAWELSDPRAPAETDLRDSTWWPREHFLPQRPLAQLPHGQFALLRRQSAILLASASNLSTHHFGRDRAAVIVPTIVLSDGPTSFQSIQQPPVRFAPRLVVRADIAARPTLVSVEFDATDAKGPPGGRTRFAVQPPPTLSAMRGGETAISAPVLLVAPSGSQALPAEADAALAQMAGSTIVEHDKRVGVYWETYGISPADTVEIAVWIERYTPQGIMRRFGIALNVVQDLNTPIVLSWREPQPSHVVHVTPGPIPIVGRSVTLDLSAVAPGDYWLDVAVSRRGSEPVRGRRSITVR